MAKNAETPPLSFEAALAKLEECIKQLEDGQVSLEVALTSYEEGVGLLNQCYGMLKSAETRIQVLNGVDEKGQPLTQPFPASQNE